MKKYPKSIITDEMDCCFICKTTINLHIHHIFGAFNRKKSTKYGLIVPLCARHHNMSDEGVHFNKKLDIKLKQLAQLKFELNHTREEFIEIFGRNYLD